ncbi:SID1 transmembrane family member 1, partial [Durusdinium trenchii]
KQVDTQFGQISPQDMATLQLRLAQTEGDARKPMEKVLGQIQKSMEARMEGATKEIEALMQSSGNIADNIRECISRQESLLPMIAVLQMNIARAQKAKNEQLERALTFLYNTINEEMESKVPMVNRVLSRCLSTEDPEPRRELLKVYFSEKSEEDKPKLMAEAIVGLAKEAQGQKDQAGFDLESALGRIREVALDVGVVASEVCGEEVQEQFMEDIQPLFDLLV